MFFVEQEIHEETTEDKEERKKESFQFGHFSNFD